MASSRPPAPPAPAESFLAAHLPPRESAEPDERPRLLPHHALAAIQDELALVPARDVKILNGNVGILYAIASSTAERVLGFLPQIRVAAPLVPIEPLLKIELYASALIYANALCTYGTDSAARKLLEEAMQLRRDLLNESKSLVHAKLMSAAPFDKLARGIGYVNVGADMIALATIYDEAWERIRGKTTIEEKQVRRADELGPILAELAGRRARDPLAADQRDRTFTLLDEAYDSAKCVISFLRWKQKDASKPRWSEAQLGLGPRRYASWSASRTSSQPGAGPWRTTRPLRATATSRGAAHRTVES